MKVNLWEYYSKSEIKAVFDFCEGYKNFISNCKTEREVVEESVKIVEKHGYKSIRDFQSCGLMPGDKVYAVNSDKSVVIAHIGTESFENGLRIVGSHIDSPRLDLKASPIYENSELCLFDTHYYGGIKKYQWVAMPLALHGVIVKKNGEKIKVRLGENDCDFTFSISDLLPHLEKTDKVQLIEGEKLNILAGSIPLRNVTKNKVKENVLKILKEYNIDEDDFFSAEIECVPAGRAQDLGLDRSMILGYGQDDRVCAYTSLMAQIDAETGKQTSVCLLVDKEEVGSIGATGMKSRFFENTIAEIINLTCCYSELTLRRCLQNSIMLSSDVTAAFDPNYPDSMNKETDAELGKGISFNKYTGSKGKYDANDANPEFIATLRNILDAANVHYQATEMGKVDQGGGGTIAHIMAKYGMNVIDAGVPLLNMHAPWEISSKADVYEAYKAYKAFIKS